ncbi:hypothetical protein B0T17DRAFT_390858 [Bombardia bombarda]|uniref:Uncharacterized protein n=1 Tax=Bombardia bombarda TaxID=252184 RepID=A0AA39WAZ4_9PEZI|nr:hypothetical protein B0T17DRAFT_390858 [Bombardia bombarda]
MLNRFWNLSLTGHDRPLGLLFACWIARPNSIVQQANLARWYFPRIAFRQASALYLIQAVSLVVGAASFITLSVSQAVGILPAFLSCNRFRGCCSLTTLGWSRTQDTHNPALNKQSLQPAEEQRATSTCPDLTRFGDSWVRYVWRRGNVIGYPSGSKRILSVAHFKLQAASRHRDWPHWLGQEAGASRLGSCQGSSATKGLAPSLLVALRAPPPRRTSYRYR